MSETNFKIGDKVLFIQNQGGVPFPAVVGTVTKLKTKAYANFDYDVLVRWDGAVGSEGYLGRELRLVDQAHIGRELCQ